jgi:hypothetical protein
MRKQRARKRFEIWELVGQGRNLAGPVGKRVRIGRGPRNQLEKGEPQPGQKMCLHLKLYAYRNTVTNDESGGTSEKAGVFCIEVPPRHNAGQTVKITKI